ncbi:MAG: NUDIX hydrolase, partial [Ilumatobacteraceae bacterium]
FATWFFVAAGSDANVEVDGAEIHEHAWLTPGEVLRRQRAGGVTLAPPTFVTLTQLAEHTAVAGLLDTLRAATPERFHTQIGRDGEINAVFWHGDESYEAQPGPPGARHRLIMFDDGWRYVRSPTTRT